MMEYEELMRQKIDKAARELMRELDDKMRHDMIGARIYYEDREAGERWLREEMAKMDSITINVVPKITVSEETLNRCLRILEMWQDDNPDKHIVGERFSDGRTVFRIVKNKETDND